MRGRPATTRKPDVVPAGVAAALSGADIGVAGVPVLRSVDLEIGLGEVVALVGPNGSGKSTLLRVLATLLRPTRGGGEVLGARLGSAGVARIRPSIGLVGHAPSLYPRLTLAENLRLVARLTGRHERVADRALDAVGLLPAAGRRAIQCSQGMQRRVDLARVMLVEPRLLLLDEAQSGLDESSAGLVDVLVTGVRARGGASVLVSHDLVRLAPLVDRVVEVRDGGVHAEEVARP